MKFQLKQFFLETALMELVKNDLAIKLQKLQNNSKNVLERENQEGFEESLIETRKKIIQSGSIDSKDVTPSKDIRDIRDVNSHEAKAAQGLPVGNRSKQSGVGELSEATDVLQPRGIPGESYSEKTIKSQDGTVRQEKNGNKILKVLNTNLSVKNGSNNSLKTVSDKWDQTRKKKFKG